MFALVSDQTTVVRSNRTTAFCNYKKLRFLCEESCILCSCLIEKLESSMFLGTARHFLDRSWMYLEEDYIGTLSSVLLPGVMVQNCSLSVRHCSCLFLYELLLGYLNYHTEKQGCFKINGMSNIDTMYDASFFSIASSTTHAKTWLQQCLDVGQFIRTETVVHNDYNIFIMWPA